MEPVSLQHGKIAKACLTDEEALRKRKEQEIKLRAYRALMMKIFSKRFKNDYDMEMLEVTGKLLIVNPNIQTLWNVRRETILKLVAENRWVLHLFLGGEGRLSSS